MPPHSHCVDSRLSVQCPCSLLTLRHHNQFVWDDDGGKWRRQHKRELVGEEWSVVVHVPLRSHWLDAVRELLINIVATDFDWPVKVISAIVPETSRIQYFAHVIQTRFQANFWASYIFQLLYSNWKVIHGHSSKWQYIDNGRDRNTNTKHYYTV